VLADLVRNPSDSPLWQDLDAIGATSSLKPRQDKRGREVKQRIWRLPEAVALRERETSTNRGRQSA
jgi:hypothetical protein